DRLLPSYARALQELRAAYLALKDGLDGRGKEDFAPRELGLLDQLAVLLQNMPGPALPALMQAEDFDAAAALVERAVQHGLARDETRQKTEAVYMPDALVCDAQLALSDWKKAELQWFLPKWLIQNRVRKLMKSMALSNS